MKWNLACGNSSDLDLVNHLKFLNREDAKEQTDVNFVNVKVGNTI